jgi:hypothetical protein
MASIFHALSVGALAILYGFVGFVIGLAVGFIPLRVIQALAQPALLTDGAVSTVSLALAVLFALLAGAGYLKTGR